MSRIGIGAVILLAVVAMVGMSFASAGQPAHVNGLASSRPIRDTSSCTGGTISDVTSSNWGGYAAQSCLSSPKSDVVTDVQGTWVQPSVTCPAGKTSYAAFWVGIDGYSSDSVEQTGTDSDCDSGTASYYAWYEMYPAAPVTLSLTIKPGNTITASVQYASSKFTLKITDVTTGSSYSVSKSLKSAARSSAEWVDEAPSSNTVLPLADFGTVTFTACTATFSGVSGPIQDSSWQTADMTMESSSGAVESATSALTSSGEGFTATWESS